MDQFQFGERLIALPVAGRFPVLRRCHTASPLFLQIRKCKQPADPVLFVLPPLGAAFLFSSGGYPGNGGGADFGEKAKPEATFYGHIPKKTGPRHTFAGKLTTIVRCGILLFANTNIRSQTMQAQVRRRWYLQGKADPGASGDRRHGALRDVSLPQKGIRILRRPAVPQGDRRRGRLGSGGKEKVVSTPGHGVRQKEVRYGRQKAVYLLQVIL